MGNIKESDDHDASHLPSLSVLPLPTPSSPTPSSPTSSSPTPPQSTCLQAYCHSDGQARHHTDGGWAWVVMVSSFMVSAVVDGTGYSVGVFLSSLQREFSANNQKVSWVSSVLNGSYLLIGPVVSFFVNQHGYRKVALLGCALTSVCFALSPLCTSIELVIFVFAFMGGIGLGFLYQPSMMFVGHYFSTRRALALGFTACGSGVGAFAFAPLFSIFVDWYSWKGATFLAAGLVLLCVFAIATFRDLEGSEKMTNLILGKPSTPTPLKTSEGDKMMPESEISTAGGSMSRAEHSLLFEISAAAVDAMHCKSCSDGEDTDSLEDGMAAAGSETGMPEGKILSRQMCHWTFREGDRCMIGEQDLSHHASCSRSCVSVSAEGIEEHKRSDDTVDILGMKEISSEDAQNVLDYRIHGLISGSAKDNHLKSFSHHKSQPVSDCDTVSMEKNSDTMDDSSKYHLTNKVQTKDLWKGPAGLQSELQNRVNGKEISHVNAQDLSEESCSTYPSFSIQDISDLSVSITDMESSCLDHCHRLVWSPLRANLYLMKRPSAVVYGIACFLTSVATYVPTTFLPLVAELMQFKSSQGAFLISILGIGNVVGRLLTGLIIHYHPRLVLPLNHSSLIMAGLLTSLLPLMTKYYLMAGYSLAFGICVGMFVVLQVMILIELLGFDHLTNAYGITNMYYGIGVFVGPPLAGFMADTTGDLNSTFYAVGAVFILAGVVCLFLRYASVMERHQVRYSPCHIDLLTRGLFYPPLHHKWNIKPEEVSRSQVLRGKTQRDEEEGIK